MAGEYEIRVITERAAFTPIALLNAVPNAPATFEHNNWGAFEFCIPTLDAQAGEVCGHELEREVQLWRDGKCLWWGVIVASHTLDEDMAWTRVQCYGLEWYFSQLYFGPIQTNYAVNGDFEAGLAGWTVTGASASLDTSWKATGTQSLRLTNSDYDEDAHASQQIVVSGNPDQAVAYKVAAVYRIDPSVTWGGPALWERGLYLERIVGGVVQDDYLWEPITNDSERDGSEVFIETPGTVSVPAGQTQTLNIRLYSPGGAINWDRVEVTVEESVSTPILGEDVATLLERIVVHYAQRGIGKYDLNIGFAYTPTGRHVFRAYQFYDHGNIWEAISEWVTAGVCDVGVVWNDAGTQRTFTVWPATPGRGTLKTDLLLDLDSGTLTNNRIAGMSYTVDGTQAGNKVRALGPGTGSTRSEAEAMDTSHTGGVVIERVVNAPLEATVGSLGEIAATELERTKRPPRTPKFRLHENAGSVIDQLSLGDTVPVVIDYGWVQENGTRRVVGISIDPETDTLEPTVN